MTRIATKPALLGVLLMCCAAAHAQNAPERPPAPPPGRDPRPTLAPPEPNTDLQALLRRVAATSGKEFLIDRRVGSYVYVGGTPLDNPTYPVLLSVLRANGLAAVEIQGRVNIVPVDVARQVPTPIVQRDDASIPDDEWVTRVITVRHVSAAQLVPVLRPLMPQTAHMAATVGPDGETLTKLIVVDRYANIRRISQIIEEIDR